MRNQITEGPWNAVKDSPSNRYTIFGAEGLAQGKVARVYAPNGEADALAIAAVPELLKLAIAVHRGIALHETQELALEALKKAGVVK